MSVLHIEHAITDFDVWTRAFNSYAERRRAAGVQRERVCRPADDPRFVIIDLEFPSRHQAEGFLAFLHAAVWASPVNSPALAGRPIGRILTVEHEVTT